jgi:hypothetical protein
MGNFRLVTGDPAYYNSMAFGTITVPSENALYLRSGLGDGRVSQPFRFNVPGTDDYITVDANRALNPGLGTWVSGTPTSWFEAGTVVETTTAGEFRTTPASKHSPSGQLFQDIIVRPGQSMNLDAWARISTTGATAAIQILLRDTNQYLTSGSVWTTTNSVTASTTSTPGFVNLTRAFTLPSFAECGYRDTVKLRIILINSGGSEFAFFDDVTLYPGVDTAAIFGHNIDSSIVAELHSSQNGLFAGDDILQATMTKNVPSFYTVLGSVQYSRHWRFRLAGTNVVGLDGVVPIQIGEAFIGQTYQPLGMYSPGQVQRFVYDHYGTETRSGEVWAKRASRHRRRAPFVFPFVWPSQAEFDEALAFWDRAEGRLWPAIAIPDTALPGVMHGRVGNVFSAARELPSLYVDGEIEFVESPFAVFSS